jgi:hypothetical protein
MEKLCLQPVCVTTVEVLVTPYTDNAAARCPLLLLLLLLLFLPRSLASVS